MVTLLETNQTPQAGVKYLLRERYDFCADGVCQVGHLTEAEKRLIKEKNAMFLTGIAQRADATNGNQRVYPFKTLAREVKNYEQLVKANRALGELDHPDDTVINLEKASHIVRDIWWEGKDVYVKLQVLSGAPGQQLRSLVDDGVAIGLSSRGLGSVRDMGGRLLVEDDFQLICFDVVSEPSTGGAFMHLMEAKRPLIESVNALYADQKSYRLRRAFSDILGR